MPAPAASEAAIKRALAAAQAAGIKVASFRVTREGTVEVIAALPVDKAPANVAPLQPRQWG